MSLEWKPKYGEGDEVPIALAKVGGGVGLGFAAWGIVLLINSVGIGTYRIKLTEILVDEYFTNKLKVGDCMTLNFGNVEIRDPKILKYLRQHKCFVFR